jgi:hypothetical protein
MLIRIINSYSDGLWDGWPGIDPWQRKIFLFSTASRLALGPTQPSVEWVPGALSPGVKQQGREADHPPPSGARVKNGGAIPPLLHVFMAWCLIKHKDNFSF